MQKVVNQYKLIPEKKVAKLLGYHATVFNYYAKQGRGPEPALVTPDGRRWYEEETVRGWKIPPRKKWGKKDEKSMGGTEEVPDREAAE